MRFYIISCLFFLSGAVFAAPDVELFLDVEGVRLFRDNMKNTLFHTAPAPVRISSDSEGRPDWHLTLYRYGGRKGTGDSGEFWARGVFTVQLESDYSPAQIQKLRKGIVERGISDPELSNMPVCGTKIRLVSGAVQQEWTHQSFSSHTRLQFLLNPEISSLLWQSYIEGQTQVSIELENCLKGVRKDNQEWSEATTSSTSTTPVEFKKEMLDFHLSKHDLDAQMSRAYTQFDIFCFDFIEETLPELYAINLEIQLKTEGRPLIRRIKFTKKSDYRALVQFPLSKDLDQPYRYRETLIFRDGRKQTSAWKLKEGETMLDITHYDATDN